MIQTYMYRQKYQTLTKSLLFNIESRSKSVFAIEVGRHMTPNQSKVWEVTLKMINAS